MKLTKEGPVRLVLLLIYQAATTFTLIMAAQAESNVTSCDDFAVFQVHLTSLLLLNDVWKHQASVL